MAYAGGADASRLHGLRGERSNVPREARFFTERGYPMKLGTGDRHLSQA